LGTKEVAATLLNQRRKKRKQLQPKPKNGKGRHLHSTLFLPGTSHQRPRSLHSNSEAKLDLLIQQQEARKLAETYVPVRQQQPPAQQLRPTLPSVDKSVQKQPMGRHQFTSIFGQPVNTSRPTRGMKRPKAMTTESSYR